MHSILFVELFAIYQALKYICELVSPQPIVILTDSLNSLQFLKNKPSARYRQLHYRIVEQIMLMVYSVLSHIGIQGNDIVDAAAKIAHSHDTVHLFPLETCEILNIFRDALKNRMIQEREEFLHFYPYGEISCCLSPFPYRAKTRKLGQDQK